MTYPQFEEDLYGIYKSEIMGEALFSVASTLSFNQSRKAKWDALAKLETQTKERYLAFVHGDQRYPTGSRIAGLAIGVLLALMPWKTAMKMVGGGTAPFMATFSRLLENSSAEDESFYRYVLQHEEAIAAFAANEARGETNALRPVTDLLERATS